MQKTQILSLGQKTPWKREWLPIPGFLPREFMNSGAWWARVHGIAKSCTRLSD